MESNFVQGKYYGLLMTAGAFTYTGSVINFTKATGFNPNVDDEKNEDNSVYLYTGTHGEGYSRQHLIKMETLENGLRFYDDHDNYFDCYKKVAICFIFDTNVGDISELLPDAFLIESVLMIYDVLNSKWVKAPHIASGGYNGISTTAVDSSRNANAKVIASVVRSDIAKVEAKWAYLTVEQYSALAKLFEQKYGGSFFVRVCFFDSIAGGFDCSREFYCGDRKVAFARIKCNEYYMPIGYENVGLNLIER